MCELYWPWLCFALTQLMIFHGSWLTAYHFPQSTGDRKTGRRGQHKGMCFRSSCCSGEWTGTSCKESTQPMPTHPSDSLSSIDINIFINKAMHMSKSIYRCTCTSLGPMQQTALLPEGLTISVILEMHVLCEVPLSSMEIIFPPPFSSGMQSSLYGSLKRKSWISSLTCNFGI